MRKVTLLGTRLPSFAAASETLAETLEVDLNTKRTERLTERIGTERVAEREVATAAFLALPLMEKLNVPLGVEAPDLACISCDGGRMQRCDLPKNAKSHWCETKVAILMRMRSKIHLCDPCPQVPDKFLDLAQMEQLTREIKGSTPSGSRFERCQDPPPTPLEEITLEPVIAEAPEVLRREVLASLADSERFGKQMAAQAWSLGFAKAARKVFIADGGSMNWGIWQREFRHQGYIPILDFIHALTYVFAAALAGREAAEGRLIYLRWITWVWQGEVPRVIAELSARVAELGAVPPDAAESDPRRIVSETLTYLTNQQSRMDYAYYRQMGYPITSSHIESAVKQISRRVKGSEKFWTGRGGEALLQLTADHLSDTKPMIQFWSRRARNQTGTKTYTPRKKTAA